MEEDHSTSLLFVNEPPLTRRQRLSNWLAKQADLLSDLRIVALMIVVVVFGIANNITGKISLVPMGNYAPLQGFFNTFLYVLFYLIVYAVRRISGIIPPNQLKWAWSADSEFNPQRASAKERSFWHTIPPIKYFVIIGILDSLTTILRLSSIPKLPGAFAAILPETNLLFSTFMGFVFFRQSYTYWQLWSVFVLMCAVFILVTPRFFSGSFSVDPLAVALLAISPAPSVVAFTIKEHIFKEFPRIDLFIVQVYSNLAQLLFLPALSPIAFQINTQLLQGAHFADYLREAIKCMAGVNSDSIMSYSDCSPMPLPYLLYIAVNILYNLLLLVVIKKGSAFLAYLVQKTVTPACVLLYAIRWPLLPVADQTVINGWVYGTVFTTIFGFVAFRYASYVKTQRNLGCCSTVFMPRPPKSRPGTVLESSDSEGEPEKMGLDPSTMTEDYIGDDMEKEVYMGMDMPTLPYISERRFTLLH